MSLLREREKMLEMRANYAASQMRRSIVASVPVTPLFGPSPIVGVSSMIKPTAIVVALALSACGSIPSKTVTLLSESGAPFEGILKYSDAYSGVITMSNGPGGESFTGRFTVIDRTATQSSQGSIYVPSGGVLPGVGSMSSSSSGQVDASGIWSAIGSKGSTMRCDLGVGRQGHGQGTCLHSNGTKYQIVL